MKSRYLVTLIFTADEPANLVDDFGNPDLFDTDPILATQSAISNIFAAFPNEFRGTKISNIAVISLEGS